MVRHLDYNVMGNPFGSPNSVDAILRNVSAILKQQEQLDYKESHTTTNISVETNSVDPDQTAIYRNSLTWVYTV